MYAYMNMCLCLLYVAFVLFLVCVSCVGLCKECDM
ncbi:putative signal peptide protein [Puccinia sorghi]|uniref:Putative signal peptide protein n=1 Tax=Puccinia sorghi TaxID=27349 RepID=A0A0L6VBC9_9BASI|nr:putative signal peptide protein [Puccinia sorghi]